MIRILLVEDQPIMMKLLKAQLERHEFMVDQAITFQTAAQKIEQDSYDVILLDLQIAWMVMVSSYSTVTRKKWYPRQLSSRPM
jgi:DNA-binding response OmpR family regulator